MVSIYEMLKKLFKLGRYCTDKKGWWQSSIIGAGEYL